MSAIPLSKANTDVFNSMRLYSSYSGKVIRHGILNPFDYQTVIHWFP